MAQKTLKPAVKKSVTLLFALSFLLISGLFIMSSVNEMLSNYRLSRELNSVKSQYAELSAEQERLVMERDRLQDENYVQNYARGTNLVSKTEETVFILPKNND